MIEKIVNNGYEVLAAGLFSAFTAQVIKFVIFTIRSRKINFKIFTTTGGMPSSHSAGVMGLSTSVGIIAGFDSILFAICSRCSSCSRENCRLFESYDGRFL